MSEKNKMPSFSALRRVFLALFFMCSLSLAIGSIITSVAPAGAGTAYGAAANFATPATKAIGASAAAGYSFVNWIKSGNCTITNPNVAGTTMNVVSGNCYVTANFVQNVSRVNLVVLTPNPNVGTVTGNASNYAAQTPKQISATLIAAGYGFGGWQIGGNCTVTNPNGASTTAMVFAGTCYATAYFVQTGQAYSNLTVMAGTGGSASGSEMNFAAPASKQITATPNANYDFANWTRTSGECTIENYTSASTSVNVNLGRCVVVANFKPKPVYANLDVSARVYEMGTVTGSESNFVAIAWKTITATPAAGNMFLNWTISGDCTIMNRNAQTTQVGVRSGTCYAIADFARIGSFSNLTVGVDSFETGRATGAASNFIAPALKQISATAYAGYVFSSWARWGNCTIANTSRANTTVSVEAGTNCQVRAYMNVDPARYGYVALWASPYNGAATLVGNQRVVAPITHPISETPAPGFRFSNWSAWGNCTIANVTAPSTSLYVNAGICNVTASFYQTTIANIYVTTTTPNYGEVRGSASGIVAPENVPIGAYARYGYRFTQWVANGNCTAANATSNFTTVNVRSGTCNVVGSFGVAGAYGSIYVTVANSTQGTARGGIFGSFPVPATKEISATPNAGYEFQYWMQSPVGAGCIVNSPTSATTAVVVSTSCTFTANFRPIPVYGTLAASASPTEAGFAAGSSYNFIVPATRSVRATANTGYVFASWVAVGNCTVADAAAAETTITVNSGTCNATANFVPAAVQQTLGSIEYAVSPAEAGVAPAPEYNFSAPATKRAFATQNGGYYFVEWSISGNCTVADATMLGTDITVNSGMCTVKAVFAKKETTSEPAPASENTTVDMNTTEGNSTASASETPMANSMADYKGNVYAYVVDLVGGSVSSLMDFFGIRMK